MRASTSLSLVLLCAAACGDAATAPDAGFAPATDGCDTLDPIEVDGPPLDLVPNGAGEVSTARVIAQDHAGTICAVQPLASAQRLTLGVPRGGMVTIVLDRAVCTEACDRTQDAHTWTDVHAGQVVRFASPTRTVEAAGVPITIVVPPGGGAVPASIQIACGAPSGNTLVSAPAGTMDVEVPCGAGATAIAALAEARTPDATLFAVSPVVALGPARTTVELGPWTVARPTAITTTAAAGTDGEVRVEAIVAPELSFLLTLGSLGQTLSAPVPGTLGVRATTVIGAPPAAVRTLIRDAEAGANVAIDLTRDLLPTLHARMAVVDRRPQITWASDGALPADVTATATVVWGDDTRHTWSVTPGVASPSAPIVFPDAALVGLGSLLSSSLSLGHFEVAAAEPGEARTSAACDSCP
jgi:hypothetical protein